MKKKTFLDLSLNSDEIRELKSQLIILNRELEQNRMKISSIQSQTEELRKSISHLSTKKDFTIKINQLLEEYQNLIDEEEQYLGKQRYLINSLNEIERSLTIQRLCDKLLFEPKHELSSSSSNINQSLPPGRPLVSLYSSNIGFNSTEDQYKPDYYNNSNSFFNLLESMDKKEKQNQHPTHSLHDDHQHQEEIQPIQTSQKPQDKQPLQTRLQIQLRKMDNIDSDGEDDTLSEDVKPSPFSTDYASIEARLFDLDKNSITFGHRLLSHDRELSRRLFGSRVWLCLYQGIYQITLKQVDLSFDLVTIERKFRHTEERLRRDCNSSFVKFFGRVDNYFTFSYTSEASLDQIMQKKNQNFSGLSDSKNRVKGSVLSIFQKYKLIKQLASILSTIPSDIDFYYVKPSKIMFNRKTTQIKLHPFTIPLDIEKLDKYYLDLNFIYAAPELFELKDNDYQLDTSGKNNQMSNVYSFAMNIWYLFNERHPTLLDLNVKPMDIELIQTYQWITLIKKGIRPSLAGLKLTEFVTYVTAIPPNLHGIISKCWSSDPASRPSFSSLKQMKESELFLDFHKFTTNQAMKWWMETFRTDVISWDDFFVQFYQYLSVGTAKLPNIKNYLCFQSVKDLLSVGKNSDNVTLKNFSLLLKLTAPLQPGVIGGIAFLSSVTYLVTLPWYHGPISREVAVNRLQDCGVHHPFLLRYSVETETLVITKSKSTGAIHIKLETSPACNFIHVLPLPTLEGFTGVHFGKSELDVKSIYGYVAAGYVVCGEEGFKFNTNEEGMFVGHGDNAMPYLESIGVFLVYIP